MVNKTQMVTHRQRDSQTDTQTDRHDYMRQTKLLRRRIHPNDLLLQTIRTHKHSLV